ncbi:MAG: hypothetical protein DMG38_24955 [Acidobacteria bacterium]|nr:MAG: hypothetical protein DMG38_24955 [Acidobacteriota bacterium]
MLPHHRSVSANELRWLHARRCFCAAKHYARQFDSAVFFVQSLYAKKYICKRASVVPNAYSDEGDQDSELIVISVPGLM